MLRQLAGGSVLTELVGKALMMAKNVSPEVSLRPRKERLGGPVFYIRCCNTDSYRKHMEARYRLQVQSVKSNIPPFRIVLPLTLYRAASPVNSLRCNAALPLNVTWPAPLISEDGSSAVVP